MPWNRRFLLDGGTNLCARRLTQVYRPIRYTCTMTTTNTAPIPAAPASHRRLSCTAALTEDHRNARAAEQLERLRWAVMQLASRRMENGTCDAELQQLAAYAAFLGSEHEPPVEVRR